MILTEDKTYTMSLETENHYSDSGLTNNTVELEFTNKELLHAILTCGMPIQRLTAAFPEKKRLETLYKLFLVETALETEGDRLKKSKKIAYLDSSEKSVISYYMGMFFTKMISHRLYGSEYLTNLNLIETPDHREYIDFFASEWRPEMIGYSPVSQSWNVWEAKGGSNYREQALKKGADQLKAIGTLNGVRPDPAAVCMTYYDHGYLCGILREPEGNTEGEQLKFSEEDFYKAYYKPVCELFLDKSSNLRLYDTYAEVSLDLPYFTEDYKEPDERKICLGISRKLLSHLMDGDYEAVAELRREKTQESCPEGAYMGMDGVYIR
ncbi:hypothetical protein [Blautia sp. MSJ-19]|uniref:hypothetical protein n=1 Tax=Blautia sp. MSJ-19 TaxID=2841517 RepID=UPI001C0EFC52|nr:hypothetical protein [Blautia sp. MSJ-19]MBU5479672.1 hypothetical protein [Blautia sp. MSJ-19]